jgi:hypothetical protein
MSQPAGTLIRNLGERVAAHRGDERDELFNVALVEHVYDGKHLNHRRSAPAPLAIENGISAGEGMIKDRKLLAKCPSSAWVNAF